MRARAAHLRSGRASAVVLVALLALSAPAALGSGSRAPAPVRGSPGLGPGIRTAFVGSSIGTTIAGLAYDPDNGWLFATAPAWNSVVVWNTTSRTVVANLSVGSRPTGISYDSDGGYVLAVDNGTDNVSVLDAAGPTVLGSVPVGTGPVGVWSYPENGTAFVTNYGSSNVSVLKVSTLRDIDSIPVLAYPSAINDGIVLHPSSDQATTIDPVTQAVVHTSRTGSDPVAESGGLVADAGANSLSDVGSAKPVAGVGRDPRGVMDDPVDQAVYVANAGSDNVTVLNASLGTESSLPLGVPLGPMAFDPEGGTVFVAGGAGGAIFALPPYVDSLVGSFAAPQSPNAIALDAPDGLLAVVNSTSANVSLVNLSTHRTELVLHLAGAPANVTFDPRIDRFLVSEPLKSRLVVIDPRTGADQNLGKGLGRPGALAVDNRTGALFVADPSTDRLLEVNASSGSVLGRVPVGREPDVVVFDNASDAILVANSGSASVTIVDPVSDTVRATVAVGQGPDGIAVDPTTGEAFVANFGSANVSELLGSRSAGSIPVGQGPASVAFDSQNTQVYALAERSANLSVFSATNGGLTATVEVPRSSEELLDLADGLLLLGAPTRGALPELAVSRYPLLSAGSFGADLSAVALDPSTNDLLLNFGNALDSANATTGAGLGPFGDFVLSDEHPEPQTAVALLPDPARNVDYAAFRLGPIYILNRTTGAEVATLPVDNAKSLALAPGGGFLFAATSHVVAIVNLTSARIVRNLSLSGDRLAVDPGLGYVYNFGGTGTLNVILLSSMTLIQTIHLSNVPLEGMVAPNGSYLDLLGADNVWAVDLASGAVAWHLSLGPGTAAGFVRDPTTGDLVIGRPAGDELEAIDPTSGRVVEMFAEAEPLVPFGVVAGPAAELLAVASVHDALVWLNLSTLAPVQRVVLLVGYSEPEGDLPVETNTDSPGPPGDGFSGGWGGGTVVGPDTTGLAGGLAVQSGLDEGLALRSGFTCHYPRHGCAIEVPLGSDPVDPVYVTATGDAWVAERGGSVVTVVHLSRLNPHVVANLSVGAAPDALLYDPALGLVYVANGGGSTLSVFDAATMAAGASIPVGPGPDALALDPSSGLLYVADGGGSSVTIVNSSSGRVVANLTVCRGPSTFSPPNAGFLAVACDRSDTLVPIFGTQVGPSVVHGQGPLFFEPAENVDRQPTSVLLIDPDEDSEATLYLGD